MGVEPSLLGGHNGSAEFHGVMKSPGSRDPFGVYRQIFGMARQIRAAELLGLLIRLTTTGRRRCADHVGADLGMCICWLIRHPPLELSGTLRWSYPAALPSANELQPL
jgi:hypothetical protein